MNQPFISKSKNKHPVTSYQAFCRIERQRDLLVKYVHESLMVTEDQKESILAHVHKLNRWLKQYRDHVTVSFNIDNHATTNTIREISHSSSTPVKAQPLK